MSGIRCWCASPTAAPPYWSPPTGGPRPRHQGAGAVINYELTYDPEVHRTASAVPAVPGQQGLALSLYQPNEAQRVNFIEEYQQAPFPRATWPGSAATSNRSRRRW